jgi:hypothetical protein
LKRMLEFAIRLTHEDLVLERKSKMVKLDNRTILFLDDFDIIRVVK